MLKAKFTSLQDAAVSKVVVIAQHKANLQTFSDYDHSSSPSPSSQGRPGTLCCNSCHCSHSVQVGFIIIKFWLTISHFFLLFPAWGEHNTRIAHISHGISKLCSILLHLAIMAANKDCDIVWEVEEEVVQLCNTWYSFKLIPFLHRCFKWKTQLMLDRKLKLKYSTSQFS